MIKIICAVDSNNGIGAKNDLLFKLKQDLARFKKLTTGDILVVGHTALLSLPGGKALPNRSTICLCSKGTERDDCYCVHSLEECIKLIKELSKTKTVWVCGGASVYKALLPYCDKIELTQVYADGKAEVFFPEISNTDFKLTYKSACMEEDQLKFVFKTYERVID